MSSHLPLDARKALVAQLAALVASERHLRVVEEEAWELTRELLHSSLAQARVPLQKNGHVGSLGDFLREWSETIASMAPQYERGPAHGAARLFIDAVQVHVAALQCACCPGGPTELCAHAWAGSPSGGECLREIECLFQSALELTRGLYLGAGIPAARLDGVSVALSTVLAAKSRARPVADIGVNGLCQLTPGSADVQLELPLHDLSARDMSAVLYVLLHELVAHAYQRVAAATRDTDRKDLFADGWMDGLAYHVSLRGVPYSNRIGALPANPLWLRDVSAAADLFRARGEAAGARHVQMGREVGDRVRWVITQMGAGPPDEPFARLTCEINLLPLSSAERIAFVQRLARHLPPFGTTPTAEYEAVPLIVNMLSDNAIARFVAAVLALI